MEEFEANDQRKDLFSRVVKAGKRTYFFDVRSMRSGEKYLTITESIKSFDDAQGRFTFQKHKLHLYKEDYEKFSDGLNDVLSYIKTGIAPPEREYE